MKLLFFGNYLTIFKNLFLKIEFYVKSLYT